MNAKIYEYGMAPSGLAKRLVRDAVVIQEETDNNSTPSVVVHLRLQTYTVVDDVVIVVTDETAGYKVTKGEVSRDVNGLVLPKNDLSGNPIFEEDGVTVADRDNAYENIIALQGMEVDSDSILDIGVKEYFLID
tara:strand:- start:332 stop:733 length:402 start_codon:yes stop_codon:yes gene_type:complete